MQAARPSSRLAVLASAVVLAACCGPRCPSPCAAPTPAAPSAVAAALAAPPPVTDAEARAIAKEAYVYGFPLVDSYRITHAYFVNPKSPEFKGAWNVIHNEARVYTPDDKAVQSPNSDTPYSMLALDLRREPIVLTVPPVEKGRYFSVQLVDAYTFNFDYVGSRTTGNDGGSFLVAGPRWQGEAPKGVAKVLRCETEIALAIFRTQLLEPSDLENVKRIQAGYRAEPLSAFAGTPPPPEVPPIDFVTPLTPDTQKTSLAFFDVLSFVLGFCPTVPAERALMDRFARIGVGAGRTLDAASLPPARREALAAGVADAWSEFGEFSKTSLETGKVGSGDLFGTREHLKGNHLYRFAAAVFGIYGNSKQEAMYPAWSLDAEGRPLDGSKHRYVVKFAADALPPANAFWSVTMYELPQSLLVANPIGRYLLNSPMLDRFVRDEDGGITFHVQAESPGADREANWLPAPKAPFRAVLRIYWPKEAALDGTWTLPPMKAAD